MQWLWKAEGNYRGPGHPKPSFGALTAIVVRPVSGNRGKQKQPVSLPYLKKKKKKKKKQEGKASLPRGTVLNGNRKKGVRAVTGETHRDRECFRWRTERRLRRGVAQGANR